MNVARILYPVNVLGPGNRIGIWLCGCSRVCPGCSNPELWTRKPQYEAPVEEVVGLIRRTSSQHVVDGFTISGGEPFEQTADLACFLEQIQDISDDILIYTGYALEELQSSSDEDVVRVLQLAAVLIDGPYIERLNTSLPLRGSENQRIHILHERFGDRYAHYLNHSPGQIQNFSTKDGVISVGIHHRGFTRHRLR